MSELATDLASTGCEHRGVLPYEPFTDPVA